MKEGTKRSIRDALLFAAFGVAIYFLLKKFFFLLFPMLLAFILSEGIRKSFRRLHPLSGIAKRILIILILLILFSLLSLFATLLAERMLRYLFTTAGYLSDQIDGISDFFLEKISLLEGFFSKILNRDMENSVSVYLPEMFEKYLQKMLESVPKWVGSVASLFPRYFLSLIIFLVCCYYFSCDWESFSSFVSKRIPEKKMQTLIRAKTVFFDSLMNFARAYLLLFLLSFSELFLGLVLLRVKGAAGIAFWIALIDLLPVLGCGTVLIPWSAFSLLAGKSALGIGLLVLYLVILVVRQLAEPKIVGTSLGLHPVISLILVIIGFSLFGVIGMILLPLIGTSFYKTIWAAPPEA